MALYSLVDIEFHQYIRLYLPFFGCTTIDTVMFFEGSMVWAWLVGTIRIVWLLRVLEGFGLYHLKILLGSSITWYPKFGYT